MAVLCDPWIQTRDVLGCSECVEERLPSASDEQVVAATEVASEILFDLSGRQFSLCTVTVRPCCRDCIPTGSQNGRSWWSSYYPTAGIIDGRWYNFGYGGPQSPCLAYECGTRIARIDLGVANVTEVAEVKIGGAVLSPDKYRLDANRWLIRTDGEMWPVAQNLTHSADDPDGWSVTMTVGNAPTAFARAAAAELACQLLLRMNGDPRCCLPDRTVKTSRQGAVYQMTDIMEIVKHGGVGLYLCDEFINAKNPHRLAQRPRLVLPRRRGPYAP